MSLLILAWRTIHGLQLGVLNCGDSNLASRDIFFSLNTSHNSATRVNRTFGAIQLTLDQGSKQPVRYFLRRLSREHDCVPGFKAVFFCELSVIQTRVLHFVDLYTVLFLS